MHVSKTPKLSYTRVTEHSDLPFFLVFFVPGTNSDPQTKLLSLSCGAIAYSLSAAHSATQASPVTRAACSHAWDLYGRERKAGDRKTQTHAPFQCFIANDFPFISKHCSWHIGWITAHIKALIHSRWCGVFTLGTFNQVYLKRDRTGKSRKIQMLRSCFGSLA